MFYGYSRDHYLSITHLKLRQGHFLKNAPILGGKWARPPRRRHTVFGLQTQPKSWLTGYTFWVNHYLEIVFSKISVVNPPPPPPPPPPPLTETLFRAKIMKIGGQGFKSLPMPLPLFSDCNVAVCLVTYITHFIKSEFQKL